MKVRITQSFVGAHGAFDKGKEYELADDVAQPYVDVGFAEMVVEDDKPKEVKPRKQRMTKAKPLNLEQLGQ